MNELARWSIAWIAVATTLAACGGGGSEPTPPPAFTAAMVQGKTFYREALSQEKMLITFSSSGSSVTLWQDQGGGSVAEIPASWSIDTKGRLVLTATLGTITVTLVADSTTYLDVSADDGTGAEPARLYKTIAFGATVPDRFAVADRDLAGVTQTVGVVALASGTPGTAVFTDGFNEDGGTTWTQAADGSLVLSSATEDNVLYLRADSVTTSPKTLRVVGHRHDAVTTDFMGIVDSILTDTPAKSGFTATMVADKVVYREAAASRSIIRYVAGTATGGDREEWYEDTGSVQYYLGTWALTPLSGSLRVLPTGAGGLPEKAAMLIEDAATLWSLLMNTGTPGASIINPASVTKTVAANAAEWAPFTWMVTEHRLGAAPAYYQITLNANGTGLDPLNQQFTWAVQGDGSILVAYPSTDTITFYQLATSAPPNRMELAGVRATGGTYTGLLVQTYTK
jgi:hypothetical protein